MQFSRNILNDLRVWSKQSSRKPLILRGARQVGKTVAGKMFGRYFDIFIYINLDKEKERLVFQRKLDVRDVYQALMLREGVSSSSDKVFLFLDEIQECPEAVEYLRYFYEELPELYVMAAGSLLEIALEKEQISFPVGRVEHRFMYPLSFSEFLGAIGVEQIIAALVTIPFPAYAYDIVKGYFERYTLIGGMPEVVAAYMETENLTTLPAIYDSLLTSYIDDAEKYARNSTMSTVLRHCIETAPLLAGQRVTFNGFGKSNYRSREVGEALRTLQRAMLINLLYPSTSIEIPILPDLKKKPRLQFLDTGLLNHAAGLQAQYFLYDDLHSFFKGRLAEHIVGQELLAVQMTRRPHLCFWVREKSQSQAEVDFIIQYLDKIIPVEVKSGPTGRLRSLHQFIDRCPHRIAVRLYAGPLEVQQAKTLAGKKFTLLNLPYFLAAMLPQYLEWLEFLEFRGHHT